MDKEKMKRLGNMRRFPIRLKQAHDTEYQRVYMYLEDEVDARIKELEQGKAYLAKRVLSFIKQGPKNRQAHDYPQYLEVKAELEQIVKEGRE